MIRPVFILVIIDLFLFPVAVKAANHYIREGASGNGSGADWTNAMSSLPSTLVRGDTYYIADGNYSSYTFDDPESGTQIITIKKATIGDHGTSTGWNNSYGDGQAVFGTLMFTSNFFIFDGAQRDESVWNASGAYGFVVYGGTGGVSGERHFDVSGADNITIRYVHAYYDDVYFTSETGLNHGLYSTSDSNNILLEKCYLKNYSWKAVFLVNSTTGPLVYRYNYIENAFYKELISSRSVDNCTFAFNYVKNVGGTGAIVADDSDNWNIYGNVFWSPNSAYDFTDVIIGTWTGDHPNRNETLNNWKIYNNTFFQMNGRTQIQIQHGNGNDVFNNLFIGFSSSVNGSLTSLNNFQNAATSLVVNAALGDFHLNEATSVAGSILPAPYNVDIDGNVRGEHGVWDIGAYEFTDGNNPSNIIAPMNFRIL